MYFLYAFIVLQGHTKPFTERETSHYYEFAIMGQSPSYSLLLNNITLSHITPLLVELKLRFP